MKNVQQTCGRSRGDGAPVRPILPGQRCALSAAVLVLLLAAGGCGDAATKADEKALVASRDTLATDPSAALFQAKAALADLHDRGLPDDPRLQLVAAEACLRLDRRTDALAYAEAGLAAGDLPADLRADLSWASGTALMGRFVELGSESDWRSANSTLEQGTEAGHHRLEAAFLLVGLQDLAGHSNPERQRKFARLVIELDTEGTQAGRVKRLLEARGLTP